MREEPDGKEKKENQQAVKQDYLPDSEGEEMRANRFSKFAAAAGEDQASETVCVQRNSEVKIWQCSWGYYD